jgi:Fe-Mn family superoxide dismutase
MTYIYTLPELDYSYDALEPYIDARTMEIHHQKHHQAYINKLNDALKSNESLQNKELKDILSDLESITCDTTRTSIENNGGGTYNHTLFWQMMAPERNDYKEGSLLRAIKEQFGSFDLFKEKMSKAATTVFGSGWAWLVVNQERKLAIVTTPNQGSPLSQGLVPVLGIDVWEHAYYLKYQNKRVDYISAWWHVINWDYAQELYAAAMR